MLTEYFHPATLGGSEWSTYYLAQGLIQKGHSVTVLTPNYGAAQVESWKNILIIRFSALFFKKWTTLSPFWLANPWWYCISTIAVLQTILKGSSDVIHVQSKSLIPAAILAKWIFKKPVVVTVRDYFTLCNHGLCLTAERNYKRCTLKYFLRTEIPTYVDEYVGSQTLSTILFAVVSGMYGRIIAMLLRFMLKQADEVICISKKQQKIFAQNQISHTSVIYNTMHFPGFNMHKINNDVFFAGRLTPGKGAGLLVEAMRELIKQKNFTQSLSLIGQGQFKKIYEGKLNKSEEKRINFFGQLSYKKTLSLIRSALLVVVPSVWEEPFGRIALEALSFGVPVVATNVGGLPEIIENRQTGIITSVSKVHLMQAIRDCIKHNKKFRINIRKNYPSLKYAFEEKPILDYLKIYQALSL